MLQKPLPTILTMGEPSGIGGEIALKAWLSSHDTLAPFCIIDSPNRLQNLANSLSLAVEIIEISNIDETADVFSHALPVFPLDLPEESLPGKLNPANGAAVIFAIEQAVKMIQSGQAGAVVTNPIHKRSLYQCGFSYPGHTEYLAALADILTKPVMMLASDRLRVIPVTRHVSLREALDMLTPGLIIETVLTANQALLQDFGLTAPRIGISALNPHAGEGGAMGSEEATLIEPAIKVLQAKGVLVTGPHPPDTLFHEEARKKYDVVLCMYHDQALIPIKTLDFDTAVNVTLGLPFIRTSPDHGTALDISGTGTASEKSLVAALKMAGQMTLNRSKNHTA
jgi:4-hydroxythreonine-4-phosphate dehydrogenase